MSQQAIEVGYDKAQGTLALVELRAALDAGWTVSSTVVSGGGHILVIVEHPDTDPNVANAS